ncbi:MAG: 5-(carboxyamino)imidazole ribonucleotide synthase [Opitutaceae bacterium]|nr:5-(carboxyamino)imidazole ribonucleotide synthase [Opitutaceae bacterium]
MIQPGSTLGVLGGGQLGRMFAQAAQTLGYRVHVYDPAPDCPASAVANRTFTADYEKTDELAAFASSCAVVTYEFENIPVAPLWKIENLTRLRPSSSVLEICQNRMREKTWLRQCGFPHVAFAEVEAHGDLPAAARRVGLPAVVKTADFGYDGKGQKKLTDDASLEAAATAFAGQRAVIERFVDFKCELSVIVARSITGETRVFPIAENIHTRHILDFTIVPARINPAVAREAESLAVAIAERLNLAGLLAVELFLTDRGELLVNELAPRPHNSGHWSIDGARTSQFEQHVRAICGLPLGDPSVREASVMVNILGDAWVSPETGRVTAPNWPVLLEHPRAKLHLYGKHEPRVGRKMGHFTVTADTPDAALESARLLKAKLVGLER